MIYSFSFGGILLGGSVEAINIGSAAIIKLEIRSIAPVTNGGCGSSIALIESLKFANLSVRSETCVAAPVAPRWMTKCSQIVWQTMDRGGAVMQLKTGYLKNIVFSEYGG